MLNLKLINAVWFVGCGFFFKIETGLFSIQLGFFLNRYRDNFFCIMTNQNLNFVCWNGPQNYQSSFISALLHVYFPPLFKNIFSSNPLNLRAFFTPTSSKEREGSLLPRVQSKNRIYKIKLFYINGVYNFLSILYISLDRRKARITSKFAHKNYCLSSFKNIYRYFFLMYKYQKTYVFVKNEITVFHLQNKK